MVRLKIPTMQPLFKFQVRLDPRTSAALSRPAMHPSIEAQARHAESEKRLVHIAHELRNRLGAITAALEVLGIAPAGGQLAAEAQAVIGRQTRQLAQVLRDIGAVPDQHAWNAAPAEQIIVNAALTWLESPADLMADGGGKGFAQGSRTHGAYADR
jgi:hypothetical protein